MWIKLDENKIDTISTVLENDIRSRVNQFEETGDEDFLYYAKSSAKALVEVIDFRKITIGTMRGIVRFKLIDDEEKINIMSEMIEASDNDEMPF